MIKILRNSSPRVLVIGDLMVDHYLWGGCSRVSPEAPVQVVDVNSETFVPGGAGNVIRNLISYGANVSVISVIGADKTGQDLFSYFVDNDVDYSKVITDQGRRTSRKTRIISSNQQVIRYDNEDKHEITIEQQRSLLCSVSELINEVDIVILSDYKKGVLTEQVVSGIISIANKAAKKVLVDPKCDDFSKYKGAYLLTPNKKEAMLATNINIHDDDSLLQAHIKLKNIANLDYSIITLGDEGISFYSDQLVQIKTVAKEVSDVTGAGDTVISSIAYALCSGFELMDALKFSNYAAAVVVSKIGSSVASFDEVESYINYLNTVDSKGNIKSIDEMSLLVIDAKQQGKKVVFTNGCFDILHAGHVSYLEEAKGFGDILVVGINSDSSITRLKGLSRPVNKCEDRARVLAALTSVDYVVEFEDDTPYRLIDAVKPAVLVKGGDYHGEVVVGSDIVDDVRIVELLVNKSTTNIITKIKGLSS